MEGIGTQRIEQDLGRLFPDARFLRMDRDTIQRKGALEKSIEQINQQEVDFVIGTQLISKGHDFKHIGMVCIVLADMSLNFPDFRSSERSFQLISQVSGRAGRDEQGEGCTMIQTYNPEHFAITAAVRADYQGFYRQEIDARIALANPPMSRLILLKISSVIETQAKLSAVKLGSILKEKENEFAFQVLGPIEAPIQKINKRYYWQVLLKSEKAGGLKRHLRQLIWNRKNALIPGNTRVSIDVDPYQML
jgi:primosomal protein N' (replication factor Y)